MRGLEPRELRDSHSRDSCSRHACWEHVQGQLLAAQVKAGETSGTSLSPSLPPSILPPPPSTSAGAGGGVEEEALCSCLRRHQHLGNATVFSSAPAAHRVLDAMGLLKRLYWH